MHWGFPAFPGLAVAAGAVIGLKVEMEGGTSVTVSMTVDGEER